MTKAEAKKKYRELTRDAKKLLDKYFDRALRSGAIDLKDAENNFILPKMIICAALKEAQFQYKPLFDSKKADRDIQNIYECTPR